MRYAWWVVLSKELKDAVRDRRALMALLIFPIIGPLVIYFLLNTMINIGEEARDVSLAVVGVDNSPDLMDFLRQNGVDIQPFAPAPDSVDFSVELSQHVDRAIAERQHNYVLIIPDDLPNLLSESRTVTLELHHDSSRTRAQVQVRRVEQLLHGWSQEVAALRLMLRGIDAGIITPINVQTIDVASPQARAQAIIGMVPMFVIMAAFVSGMGVAMDQTAGERERKSLEPLLVNPVSRSSIVFGKWMAAVVFSLLGLCLVLGLNLFALSLVPLEQIGLTVDIGALEVAGILVTTLPLAFFGTSIQIFVGIYARSFKDAQAYLSLITMLPMLPYFYNVFNSQGREFWMNFVPMLGQNMLLADVVSGRTIALLDVLLASLTVLLCSALFMALAVRAFRREGIIF